MCATKQISFAVANTKWVLGSIPRARLVAWAGFGAHWGQAPKFIVRSERARSQNWQSVWLLTKNILTRLIRKSQFIWLHTSPTLAPPLPYDDMISHHSPITMSLTSSFAKSGTMPTRRKTTILLSQTVAKAVMLPKCKTRLKMTCRSF
jgi:hypothetical protein